MASTTTVTHGRSRGDDYGLAAIAEHNASGTEQFPPYAEDAKGLGIYVSTDAQETLELTTDHITARRLRSSLSRRSQLRAKSANTQSKRWHPHQERPYDPKNRLAFQHQQVQNVDVAHQQVQEDQEKQARQVENSPADRTAFRIDEGHGCALEGHGRVGAPPS